MSQEKYLTIEKLRMVLNLKNILGAAGTAALIRGPTVSISVRQRRLQ